jgi:hypothetical protein
MSYLMHTKNKYKITEHGNYLLYTRKGIHTKRQQQFSASTLYEDGDMSFLYVANKAHIHICFIGKWRCMSLSEKQILRNVFDKVDVEDWYEHHLRSCRRWSTT